MIQTVSIALQIDEAQKAYEKLVQEEHPIKRIKQSDSKQVRVEEVCIFGKDCQHKLNS